MKNWRLVTIFFMSLALLGSAACQPSPADQEAKEPVEVMRGDLTVSVSGNGKIGLSDETHLTFGIAGRLEKIYFGEDDRVAKGEVLAGLETDSLELAISQAEMAYTTAELAITQSELAVTQARLARQAAQFELDKAENLFEWPDIEIAKANVDRARSSVETAHYRLSQATTPEEIADRTANVALAEAFFLAEQAKLQAMLSGADTDEVALKRLSLEAAEQSLATTNQTVEANRQSLELSAQSLAQARAQLDKAVITAPFDGVITSLDADEGDTVSTVTPIFHLVDPDSLELNVEVDEIDVVGVKPGQRVIIEMDALPDRRLEGKVKSLSLLPAQVSGVVVYNARVTLDVPPDIELRSGMSATADIVIAEEKDVLLVPERVIQQDDQGNTFVEVIANGQTGERAVVTGISDGFFTVVTGGLEEGELVVEKQG